MATYAQTNYIESDADKAAKTTTLDTIWSKVKNAAQAKVNFANTGTADGSMGLRGGLASTGINIGFQAIGAALGQIPYVGSLLKMAVGIGGGMAEGAMDDRTMGKIYENARAKLAKDGRIDHNEINTSFLFLTQKKGMQDAITQAVSGLLELQKTTPKVVEVMSALSKTQEPTCQTFLDFYTVYAQYRQSYNKAAAGIGFIHAWALQADEVLDSVDKHTRDWKTSIDKASDEYFRQTGFGVEGRRYHATHCKKVESGWFSSGLVGYCRGGN
ncbi:MAG: hypothetical protein IV100_19160 [Myxococcales bacterium]|nr:hypothetical protein [Myxococcales bacterium]